MLWCQAIDCQLRFRCRAVRTCSSSCCLQKTWVQFFFVLLFTSCVMMYDGCNVLGRNYSVLIQCRYVVMSDNSGWWWNRIFIELFWGSEHMMEKCCKNIKCMCLYVLNMILLYLYLHAVNISILFQWAVVSIADLTCMCGF